MKNLIKNKNSTVLDAGRRVLEIEAGAVMALVDRINSEFEAATDLLNHCTGRVIVSGVGKSGVIGRKIAATLSSTGTPAMFMHASDGMHGDLGVLREGDVMIWISKSGNSEEFNGMYPLLKRIGVPIIAFSGNMDSQLVRNSDVVLDVSVEEEACPNDLAPTASTTATLALGDALAIATLTRRDFSKEDFAYLHPGGSLGRQLLLRIDDIMFTGDDLPVVPLDSDFRQIIPEMNSKRFGGTCVVDNDGKLAGIITDGDLKRLLEKSESLDELKAENVMNPNPKTVLTGSLAAKAMHIMKKFNILQIIVVDNDDKLLGMVHLHHLLKEGLS